MARVMLPIRRIVLLAAALALVVMVFAILAWGFVHASLPMEDGTIVSAGNRAPVSVRRDAQGAVQIVGADRADVAFATGFVHAQDRFFQMDLLRRNAAGELAELFGAQALPIDEAHRLFRFRARAQAAVAALDPEQKLLLRRYTEGVNAGLSKLRAWPFEYGVLMQRPKPWTQADSLLVIWSMYFDLQGNLLPRKIARGWLEAHMTRDQAAFFLPTASVFDAPLDVSNVRLAGTPLPASAPAWLQPAQHAYALADGGTSSSVGSNAWALAGWRTKTGSAIVSNDMHLHLSLPNTWYRIALSFPDARGAMRHVQGVSLPGVPLVIAGSNDHIAWGLTNSYSDCLDLVEVQLDRTNGSRYRDGDAWKMGRSYVETINVRGSSPTKIKVLETEEGPVREIGGRSYAVHWVAEQRGAIDLGLQDLEQADDVRAGQAVAARSGVPALNFIVGDAQGHIGWTVAGALPNRDALPQGGQHAWTALLPPAAHPVVDDPSTGQLWSANNRQLMGDDYREIGDGGADIGARALQLRDDLAQLGNQVDEAAGYQVLTDDRARFVAPWRARALAVLDQDALANRLDRQEFRRLLQTSWTGRASVDSVGYRLARMDIAAIYTELFGTVDRTLHGIDRHASYAKANPRWSEVAARLLDEKPAHWLPPGTSWRDVQLAAIDLVIRDAVAADGNLANATWGRRNTTAIVHPFAAMWRPLARVLGAPAQPIAGDDNMPRVAGPAFGPSERIVVSPGHEDHALFDMPGGQTGNPLSPQFLAGHAAWAEMRPGALLPGKPVHELRIVPRG